MSLSLSLPPGPRLPMAVQTWLWLYRPIELLRSCRARYGDTFLLELGGTGKCVITCDRASVKQIFTGDPEQLSASAVNELLEPIVGRHSLLLLEGARHLRQRRLLLPPFHGERMKLYAEAMQRVTEQRLSSWPTARKFALLPETQRITLDVMLRTVFGVHGELSELRTRLEALLSVGDSPFAALGVLPMFQVDLPGSPYRRFLEHRARASAEIRRLIAQRRSAHANERPADERNDVLSLLLSATDEDGSQLSDDELHDELITLVVAGHETTATSICWAFEKILSTPAVHARLQDELDSVLGDTLTHGQHITSEQLGKLEYLDATIKESLRLRPVVPLVGRRLRSPLRLKHWQLPTGFVVTPSIYLTHYEPSIYPAPEAMRPERFLESSPEAHSAARTDPYSWFPFGGGTRRCLGMAFALYEMKVVIATIMSQRQLTLEQPAPLRVVRRITMLSPERGLMLSARPRT